MARPVDDPLKQFNVYLPVSLIQALKHYAVDSEQSLSAITSVALQAFLESQTSSKRKASGHGK